MDTTRIREPNHYRLTAEGSSFELHQNTTGQWIPTYNGRTWTQEQFASYMESGPLGRMITLNTKDPRQPNVCPIAPSRSPACTGRQAAGREFLDSLGEPLHRVHHRY
jgi:hypothetical protein